MTGYTMFSPSEGPVHLNNSKWIALATVIPGGTSLSFQDLKGIFINLQNLLGLLN